MRVHKSIRPAAFAAVAAVAAALAPGHGAAQTTTTDVVAAPSTAGDPVAPAGLEGMRSGGAFHAGAATGGPDTAGSEELGPWRAAVRPASAPSPSRDHLYVTVPDAGDVVVVDRRTMTVVDTISLGGRPLGLAVTPDGSTVVVAVATTNVAAIVDAGTRTVVGQVPIQTPGGDPWDVAVTPDGTKAYVTSPLVSRVHVLDLVNRVQTKELPMSSWQGLTPHPLGIAISPDASAVYVLDSAAGIAELIVPAYDNWGEGAVFLPGPADEIAIAPDGSRAIAVGSRAPAFFDVTTARLVPSTLADLGRGLDVAVAGDLAFVANQDAEGGPYVDVYRLSTAELVSSFWIEAEAMLEAVAAFDASHVYACLSTGWASGTVVEIDPLGGTMGPFVNVGGRPFRAAIVRSDAVNVVSFFLPTAVRMRLAGVGKDALATSGLFDDGDLPVDFTQPVTLEVGDFARTFQLQPNRRKTVYSYRSPELALSITPNLRGSSRGRFRLKIRKTTLQGLVAPDGPCELHFRAAGLPDMAGTVVLEDCGYRRARKRGALTSPPFFAGLGQFTLRGEGQDSCIVRWGFSSGQTTPETLSDVRIGIGALDRTIPGDAFVRSPKRGEELFVATLVEGVSKITVSLDYKRELARVVAKNVELGPLQAGTATDFVLDPGNGAGVMTNHVRLGGAGTKVFY